MQTFTPTVTQSKYLKPFLLNADYAARYARCLKDVESKSKTQLQALYPHEYNSLRSRKQSRKQVDSRLKDIRNWLVHVGPRPAEGWTLDEVVRGKGYVLSNCRWAMRDGLQLENRKITKWHRMPDGRNLLTKQFAQELGIRPNALRKQLRKGRSVQHLLDHYQRNRGLHAWQFPDYLVHMLEPRYQRRTRFQQSRIEWYIHYFENTINRAVMEPRETRDALYSELERVQLERDALIRQQEQQAAHDLERLVNALKARPGSAALMSRVA